MKKSVLFIVVPLALATLGLGASEAKKAIEKRISPVGQVCVEGQDCVNLTQSLPVLTKTSGVSRDGEAIYEKACATCHSIGLAGAPKFGDKFTWGDRVDKKIENLVGSVTNGLNGMPAMGMCFDCTEEELTDSVQFMLDALN